MQKPKIMYELYQKVEIFPCTFLHQINTRIGRAFHKL